MKKIFLMLAAVAAAISSQAQEPKATADMATTLNQKCPMTYTDGMLLQEVKLDDNSFVFVFVIPDDMFASMQGLGEILHDSLVAEISSSPDKDINQLVALCKASGYDIKQLFTDSKGNSFTIVITPADLN